MLISCSLCCAGKCLRASSGVALICSVFRFLYWKYTHHVRIWDINMPTSLQFSQSTTVNQINWSQSEWTPAYHILRWLKPVSLTADVKKNKKYKTKNKKERHAVCCAFFFFFSNSLFIPLKWSLKLRNQSTVLGGKVILRTNLSL